MHESISYRFRGGWEFDARRSFRFNGPPGEAVGMSGCPQLGPDGKCQGLYLGFACIRAKCLMQDKEAVCPHCIGGDYCTKYNRFGCIGPENCATENDYLAHIRQARDKALG